ncbi:phage tail assembly chaperone [Actinocorallia sp. API 0066]|uniref:phage tail assembly chaperone n=1 Tax=Actinocorallia sp. API 0066 TaxID=2896846 RepID=UPI001E2FE994|nr:phage tail assembly chaperone [Actinocorallia sp. API 0066]MCD0450764.1 phage tail assembly chaperone [Actinocorallia sp. API 0066]
MAFLTKDAILAASDRAHRDVDVPEWGGTVRVMALSGTDRDAFEAAFVDAKGGKGGPSASVRLHNFRAKLLVKCLVDDQGNRLFTNADATELGQKSAAVVDRLFDIARELSGMDDDAEAEGKDDSEPDPSDGSTTG